MVPSKLWPTMPSEIMRLENLHGYLKFPGPLPVASIRLKYVARKEAAARFVPREEDGAAPAPDDGGMPISEKGTGIDVVEDGAAEPEERAPEPLPLQGELDLALGEASPTAERRMAAPRKPIFRGCRNSRR